MGDVNVLDSSDHVEGEDLVDCEYCGRHFKIDRIETHKCICGKQKQRKPFDVCLQRIKGTEAEKFYKKSKVRGQPEKNLAPQKDWRKEHEEFINTLRAARQATAILKRGGTVKDLPPLPPTDYSDYIQCPTCLRKFNATAAKRHIPKCAEMQHNKPKPKPAKAPVKPGAKNVPAPKTRH